MTDSLYIYGYKLTYEEKVKGEETYIFINGWCSHRRFWEPIIKDFYPYGRCVTLDLPGHYPSLPPEDFESIDLEEMIDILSEAIKKINWGKPVTLVGHSAGGLACLGIASKYPALIKKVIAITPASHGPVGGFLAPVAFAYKNHLGQLVKFFHKSTAHLPFSMEAFFLAAVHDKNRFYTTPTNTEFLNQYKDWFSHLDADVMGSYLLMLDSCDIRPYAREIKCPVLLISGKYDQVVPLSHQKGLAMQIADAEYFELPHSGHIPTLEEREKSISKIKHWIEQTDLKLKALKVV